MNIKTVGIDVSKATLDMNALPESFERRYSNDEVGLAALRDDLLAQHQRELYALGASREVAQQVAVNAHSTN